jgi:mRNA-degrading endonuclease RelE of RelBE toxin-antitoxin system
VERLEDLAAGRAANADVRKLVDVRPATWRLRVGRFRALFRKVDEDVVVFNVDDRRDVYR